MADPNYYKKNIIDLSSKLKREVGDAFIKLLIYSGDPITDAELRESVDITTISYTATESITLDGSAANQTLPEQIQSYFGDYESDELFVSVIPNAKLHKTSSVFNSQNRLVFNSIGNSSWLHKVRIQSERSQSTIWKGVLNSTLESQIQEPECHIREGFNLVRQGTYYHWVTEFLPNIQGLLKYQKKTGNKPPIIVEPSPPEWVLDYLSILGFEERVVPMRSDTITVGTLITPSRRLRIDQSFNPSTNDLEWVGETYRDAVSAVTESNTERIFISREDADSRRLVNRDELQTELSKLGFESYKLTEYSVADQIKLFSKADCVVGTHGAGLSNIIYSQNVKLLEIIPEDFYWHDFYCICEQLGHGYDYYRTEQNENDNLHVDVDVILKRVQDFLN